MMNDIKKKQDKPPLKAAQPEENCVVAPKKRSQWDADEHARVLRRHAEIEERRKEIAAQKEQMQSAVIGAQQPQDRPPPMKREERPLPA